MSKVKVLFNGFSCINGSKMKANCSCTLITGPNNIIVDTMTPWDKDKILKGLLVLVVVGWYIIKQRLIACNNML